MRRRADGALELRVNGVFVMDDVETTSERRLAEVVLERGARDVLVGGLGLGFTVRALLAERGRRRSSWPSCTRRSWRPPPSTTPAGDRRRRRPRPRAAQPDAAWTRCCSTSTTARTPSCTPTTRRSTATPSWPSACGCCGPAARSRCGRWPTPPTCATTLAHHLVDVAGRAVPVSLQGRDEAYWILTRLDADVTPLREPRPTR